MNVRRWLIPVSMLTLTACAAPIKVQDCALPPPLPASVIEQAERQQETFSSRGRSLLEFFETLIERR